MLCLFGTGDKIVDKADTLYDCYGLSLPKQTLR